MAIDKLQEKIRKTKNPLAVDLSMMPEHIPVDIREKHNSFMQAYQDYTLQLLDALKATVPAVRFDFGAFAIYGLEGLETLRVLLLKAKTHGYYIFLEGVEALSAASADKAAEALFSKDGLWTFDGLILVSNIGSDGISPYTARMKETDKDLFVVVRTANRSAAEVQDLLTGSRLAHIAKADIANRFSQPFLGRSGYSRVAFMAAASSADSLRTLRGNYKNMFMLLDGCDYPNANAKNCSNAFDKLGHGAIACAGFSITGAWQNEAEEGNYLDAAICAAQRHKKNLTRYITIL